MYRGAAVMPAYHFYFHFLTVPESYNNAAKTLKKQTVDTENIVL